MPLNQGNDSQFHHTRLAPFSEVNLTTHVVDYKKWLTVLVEVISKGLKIKLNTSFGQIKLLLIQSPLLRTDTQHHALFMSHNNTAIKGFGHLLS